MAKRTRMWCSDEFKRMVDIRRIEHGEKNSIEFTSKVAKNPDLLKGVKNAEKKFKTPRLF